MLFVRIMHRAECQDKHDMPLHQDPDLFFSWRAKQWNELRKMIFSLCLEKLMINLSSCLQYSYDEWQILCLAKRTETQSWNRLDSSEMKRANGRYTGQLRKRSTIDYRTWNQSTNNEKSSSTSISSEKKKVSVSTLQGHALALSLSSYPSNKVVLCCRCQ